ncbi:MAG: hypothetical protein H2057_02210 [Alphaproteobacteria bacterium]|nr:hypothetical protein [Alphaproteobacteria bacterium]
MKKIIKLSIVASLMCGVSVGYASDDQGDDKKPVAPVTPVVDTSVDDKKIDGDAGGTSVVVDDKKDTPSGGTDAITPEDIKPADDGSKDAGKTGGDVGGGSAGGKVKKKKSGCFSCFSSK